MSVAYFLIFILFAISNDFGSCESDADVQHRKDLEQINYYNWLLSRHRTEKAKIEKFHKDIRTDRSKQLEKILESPVPRNVTLISTARNFEKIHTYLHPYNISRIPGVPSTPTQKDGGLVQFLLSEDEYHKFAPFLKEKTLKKE